MVDRRTTQPSHAPPAGGTPENPNLCNYVISVIVFSWIANIAVHMLQCFTCNLCGAA